MNVIELLKKDHEKVSTLFKSFQSAKESDDAREKERVVGQICQELTVHATVEEELFYPAVAARADDDEKAEDSVKEANEEHSLVKTLVGELEGLSPDDEQYDAKVKVLKDLVDHHVEEEEGQLMPKARKLLSSEELNDIGTRVEQRKANLQTETVQAKGASRSQARSSSSSRSSAASRSRSAPRTSRASRATRTSKRSGRKGRTRAK